MAVSAITGVTELTAVASVPSLSEADAARAAPDYEAKMKRFDDLANTVLDTSGKSTEKDRLQAYVSITEMAVTAQLRGMGSDRSKTLDKVFFESDIGQRSQTLQREQSAAVMNAPEGQGIKTALAFYDGLSASDQEIYFQTAINAPLSNGKKYSSVQQWRDHMTAVDLISTYTNANREKIRAGFNKADDPKLAEAMRLGDLGEAWKAKPTDTWSAMVLQLFASDGPKDKIDLSEDAQKIVGELTVASVRFAKPYEQGLITSKTV